jgi:hypothetical protein
MNKKQYIQPLTEAIEMELCEMIAISGINTNLDEKEDLEWAEDMVDDDR